MAGRLAGLFLHLLLILALFALSSPKKHEGEDKPAWAKKDIRDYTDADLERLLDQWEEDEEPLPADELPEHLRPQPQIHFDPSNIGDPEQLLKMSKKGRTLMMFVQVKDELSSSEAEEVTKLWQSSLHNSHIQAERHQKWILGYFGNPVTSGVQLSENDYIYMVDERRAIFMFKDGAQAWDAKDFLVAQKDLKECSIENKVYHGHYTPEGKKEKEEAYAKKIEEKKARKKKKTEL